MDPLRLVFMGTPDIAVPALAALIEAGHDIVCAYSQPPRPAGRGHRETPSPVQDFAARHHIDIKCPASLKDPESQAGFVALNADAAVVIAYGLILPAAVLRAPRLGCFNIHMSLLPRWRGAAPIQRAIMAGDRETGVTIMQMDEGLDTGAILACEAIPILPATTAGDLHDALAGIGARLIVDTLAGLVSGRVTAKPQPAAGATYARKLTREEGRLDWRCPADELDRRIRALNPWPGTWFDCGGERIRVLAAEPVAGDGGKPPGLVLDEAPTIACGAGRLRLVRLQRPGRAGLPAAAFLRGYKLPPGTVLELPPGREP
jgi:methionyl-tRNA formyltransferase